MFAFRILPDSSQFFLTILFSFDTFPMNFVCFGTHHFKSDCLKAIQVLPPPRHISNTQIPLLSPISRKGMFHGSILLFD